MEQVYAWLGKPILVDVASMGSHAYRSWWLWINITPPKILQHAYQLVPWPKGFILNSILDLGCMSQMVQHGDLPLNIVNKAIQLWVDMIMSFSSSHAFCDDDSNIIWDSKHSCWVEHNVDVFMNVLWGSIMIVLTFLAY
jgi:hypothetical protein